MNKIKWFKVLINNNLLQNTPRQRTICEVIRQIEKKANTKEISDLCDEALVYAKKMDKKLRYYKFYSEKDMGYKRQEKGFIGEEHYEKKRKRELGLK
jgi:hypothetical protein